MGSGTTAIACIDLNRRYIGYELNLEYYNECINNIEGYIKAKIDNMKELKSSFLMLKIND